MPTDRTPHRVRRALELLDAQPDDRVLEIGCGGGHAVAAVCTRLTTGTITAIDRSATMVARARALNRACVEAGRARIEHAALEGATLGEPFAKLFAVDVNAFWTAPAPSFAALARLLTPGGCAFLVHEPPDAARIRALHRALPGHVAAAGLDVVEARVTREGARQLVSVVARRPIGPAPTPIASGDP